MVEDDPTIEPGIGDADTARPQELPIRTAEKAEHPVDSNPEGAVGQDSKTNQPILRGVLASGAVALFIATIYAYLEVAGLIHVGTARVILFFGWLVGVIGIVVSEQIWGRTLKHKLRVGMVASRALAAILFLLDVWTVRHLPPAP